MKTFFRDYMELQRHSNRWIKKHWKGYILLTIGIFVSYFAAFVLIDVIKDKKKEVTNKEDSVEEES